MRTIIFDLDGTLADTSGDLIAAANVCFQTMGLGELLDPKQDQRIAVAGGRAMLRVGLERSGKAPTEGEVNRYFPVFLEAYANDIDRYTTIYPGCVAAIERLSSAGYGVGVCTNKPELLADDLLSRLGMRELFGSLIGADTLPVRKPDPAPLNAAIERVGGDPGRSILVGDSATDRETARAAEVKSLLVTFGPDGRGVEKLAPDGLLHHYEDLDQVVSRLIG